jgi:hypothetical protein
MAINPQIAQNNFMPRDYWDSWTAVKIPFSKYT